VALPRLRLGNMFVRPGLIALVLPLRIDLVASLVECGNDFVIFSKILAALIRFGNDEAGESRSAWR
jgi:hypothetical protein